VVERRLWPTIFETIRREVPDFSCWQMKVWRRSLTLAFLTPAILKYLSIVVLIFLIRRGRPVLVIKRLEFVDFGLMLI